MCRVLAYIGPEIPLESLLLQPENSQGSDTANALTTFSASTVATARGSTAGRPVKPVVIILTLLPSVVRSWINQPIR